MKKSSLKLHCPKTRSGKGIGTLKNTTAKLPLVGLCLVFLLQCQKPANQDPSEWDILFENAIILTMNPNLRVFERGFLAIKGDKIVALGSSLPKNYSARKKINAAGKLIMPGLINTHTHAAMVLFRGLADDLPLQEWLMEHIVPAEKKYINEENVEKAVELAIIEMIASGTTTFNDMYFYSEKTAEVAQRIGMRALVAEGFTRFKSPRGLNDAQTLKLSEKLITKYQNHPLISIAVAPHSPYACSETSLIEAAELAKKYKVPLHIHLDETEIEHQTFLQEKKKTPTQFLADLGVLGSKTIAAHCVKVNDEDIAILQKTQTGVSHNPESNMKLTSGIAPIFEMLSANLKVGLGTDGAASNNNLDMFEELSTATRLHKLDSQNPLFITARQIIKMATIGGAQVLGLDDKIGSLEVGKLADLIVVDLQKPHLKPLYDPYSAIAYSMQSSDIETVIINGQIVLHKGIFKTTDPQRAMGEVEKLSRRIKKDFGILEE
jgi:5-methylthioadenosine/S-adenosylhomocysteine deaminase